MNQRKLPLLVLALTAIAGLINTSSVNAQVTNYGTGTGIDGTDNSHFGYEAGKNAGNTSNNNVFIGHRAGVSNTSGFSNTFVGSASGLLNLTGWNGTFLGNYAGYSMVDQPDNTFIGTYSGRFNTGASNTFLGASAGTNSIVGNRNTFMGCYSGSSATGSQNVFIGVQSGSLNTGSNNVFIGTWAGNFANNYSNTLFIENTSQSTPLIYGDFATDKVGINTTVVPDGYTLGVNGKVIAGELKIQQVSGWADYVFLPSYQLRSLSEVEAHIKEKGHLPEVPSAKAIQQNEGYELGAMDVTLLKKIEELTLYAITAQKEIEELKQENVKLKEEILNRLKNLEKKSSMNIPLP